MEKILIYLLKGKKKLAVLFNNNQELNGVKDLLDINPESIILNGTIKDIDQILERWEISSTTVKNITKTQNSFKVLVEIDCKLLLRKHPKV
jgi:hypothetical protein